MVTLVLLSVSGLGKFVSFVFFDPLSVKSDVFPFECPFVSVEVFGGDGEEANDRKGVPRGVSLAPLAALLKRGKPPRPPLLCAAPRPLYPLLWAGFRPRSALEWWYDVEA